MAIAPTRLWTIADLSELESLPGDRRHEVWAGTLIELPVEGFRHSATVVRIAATIQTFAWSDRLGDVTAANGGYVIARDPMMLFIPDVAFVRAERVPEDDEGILELVPDLVVEVVSPTDLANDVYEKVAVYLSANVPLVWVVHPRQRLVHVYQAGQTDVVGQVHAGDELDGGDVLPGLRLPVAEIFG